MTDAVRAKVNTLIQEAFPTTRVLFENHKGAQPKGVAWVHVGYNPNKSARKDMGDTKIWRHMGVVVINIMVPEDSGTSNLWDLSDTALYAVADKKFSLGADGYLSLKYAERRNRGLVNGWYVHNIQVEYFQDVVAP